MLMLTLAISCLTSSNFPWFMGLTFQVPTQYCSLQHQTSLPSPVTSTTGYWFCFGFISSFFLFMSSLISSCILCTCWLGEFIFQLSSFLPFHTVYGILKARIMKWFSIPSSVDHVLSDMTRLSWVALYGMAHSFIQLDKVVIHVISVISFLWLCYSFCLPSDG